MSTQIHPDDNICTFCGFAASEPLHDPKYGAHEFQAPAIEERIEVTLPEGYQPRAFEPVTGNLHAYTKPAPRYYVVYSAAGYMDLRYYFYRGEIETAEDIRRVIQCIAETHFIKEPVFVNWKRIS